MRTDKLRGLEGESRLPGVEPEGLDVAHGRAAAAAGPTRVVIAEDHPIMREGLIDLLGREPAVEFAGWADTRLGVFSLIAQVQPDVLVLDLTLGEDDGEEVAGYLIRERPGLRIIVLSMHDERGIADRLLSLGVFAYVTKDRTLTEFLVALRAVASGRRYMTQEQTERFSSTPAQAGYRHPESVLSHREMAVLRALASGKTSEAIAAELSMAPKTVYSHRRNISAKLGIATGRDMIRYAVYWFRRFG